MKFVEWKETLDVKKNIIGVKCLINVVSGWFYYRSYILVFIKEF